MLACLEMLRKLSWVTLYKQEAISRCHLSGRPLLVNLIAIFSSRLKSSQRARRAVTTPRSSSSEGCNWWATWRATSAAWATPPCKARSRRLSLEEGGGSAARLPRFIVARCLMGVKGRSKKLDHRGGGKVDQFLVKQAFLREDLRGPQERRPATPVGLPLEQLEKPELLAEYPGNPPAVERRRRLWRSEAVKPCRPTQGDGASSRSRTS